MIVTLNIKRKHSLELISSQCCLFKVSTSEFSWLMVSRSPVMVLFRSFLSSLACLSSRLLQLIDSLHLSTSSSSLFIIESFSSITVWEWRVLSILCGYFIRFFFAVFLKFLQVSLQLNYLFAIFFDLNISLINCRILEMSPYWIRFRNLKV